jgi:hypothetical protein
MLRQNIRESLARIFDLASGFFGAGGTWVAINKRKATASMQPRVLCLESCTVLDTSFPRQS